MLRKAALLLIGLHCLLPVAAQADTVSFKATDGIRVYGDFQRASERSRGTIVLFHMAGSNKGEYRPLTPVLNAAGFSTLAIDQRSGGNLWGEANQTIAKAGDGYGYVDALADLKAAVRYAGKNSAGPVIIWGSSYSSALVFIVAAEDAQVRGLLAFSPAEYIEGYSIAGEAAKLTIPAFVTSASDAGEVESARTIADAVPNRMAVHYVPANGTHGSSTLRLDQNPDGAVETWKHVIAFLNQEFPQK